MGTQLADAALDRLGSGTAVWCGWVTRSHQPSLPPAAFEKVTPSLIKDNETCMYISGSSEGRLVAGVWPKCKVPRLERFKSKHAYCVASAPIVDVTLALRQDDSPQPHPGAIKCSAIRTRTSAELAELRDMAYPGIRKGIAIVKSNDIKSEPNLSSSKTDVKPKNGIAGMFAKQTSAPNIKPSQVKSPENVKVEKKTESLIENKETDKITEKSSKSLKRTAKVDEKPQSQKKVKTVEKKNSKNSKKRKRIEVIDSDSDDSDRDIFENDEKEVHAPEINFDEEEEIPPTPEVPKRKLQPINPQKRKRDKTYMGEDGYFHTMKNVLCSDDEAAEDDQKENNVNENMEEIPNTPDVPAEKPNAKTDKKPTPITKTKSKSSKKASPPSQGKQSNIMNFFKKK